MADPNTGGLFDRLANLVELVTTLDVRVSNALEGLEEMRASVTGLDPVREDITALVADVRDRLDAWDERLNRDLDDIKAVVMDKLNGLDLTAFDARFERMEESMRNVERSTTNMDHALTGTMEALPNFVGRRIKDEAARRASEVEGRLTHDDLGH